MMIEIPQNDLKRSQKNQTHKQYKKIPSTHRYLPFCQFHAERLYISKLPVYDLIYLISLTESTSPALHDDLQRRYLRKVAHLTGSAATLKPPIMPVLQRFREECERYGRRRRVLSRKITENVNGYIIMNVLMDTKYVTISTQNRKIYKY